MYGSSIPLLGYYCSSYACTVQSLTADVSHTDVHSTLGMCTGMYLYVLVNFGHVSFLKNMYMYKSMSYPLHVHACVLLVGCCS